VPQLRHESEYRLMVLARAVIFNHLFHFLEEEQHAHRNITPPLNAAAHSSSSTLPCREVAMRFISLLGIAVLLTSVTQASTILKITNSTTMSVTYDVSGKVTDDQGHDLGTFVDTITLKPKDMATYGGDTGLESG
jgi:hypothetical protein